MGVFWSRLDVVWSHLCSSFSGVVGIGWGRFWGLFWGGLQPWLDLAMVL